MLENPNGLRFLWAFINLPFIHYLIYIIILYKFTLYSLYNLYINIPFNKIYSVIYNLYNIRFGILKE